MTIREALFSLDPLNYNKGKQYFKEQFKICNNLKFPDIVHESTKEIYFKKLGIDLDKIPDNLYKAFTQENKKIIYDERVFRRELLDHPIEFYYNHNNK